MKRLLIILIAIVIFVSAMTYFIYQSQQKSVHEEQVEANKVRDLQRAEQREKLLAPIREAEQKKGSQLELDEALATLPIAQRSHYTLGFKAGLEKILFYGQVIDQYGKPVVGAQVEVSIGGRLLAHGKGSGTFITDKEGRFQVDKAVGGSLRVGHILHPTIQYKSPIRRKGDPSGNSFWGYQHTKGGNHLLWTDTSEDKPHIFKAFRIESLEHILHANTGFDFEPDGRVYTLSFNHKYPNQYKQIEGNGDGQLKVAFYVDPLPEGEKPYESKRNWWVELEAIDGGILEAGNDPYLNLAPESGYKNKIRIEQFSNGKAGPHEIHNQRYYYTANNSSVYGALEISFVAMTFRKKQKPYLRIKHKLNPNSSRNLAVK